MAKIHLVEKNVCEDNSGAVDINASFNAYYELAHATLTLEVDMILSNATSGASGSATVVKPFTVKKVSSALRNAALKAMDYYIQKDLKLPYKDDGVSTEKVANEIEIAALKLSYERHFNGAAATILNNLVED